MERLTSELVEQKPLNCPKKHEKGSDAAELAQLAALALEAAAAVEHCLDQSVELPCDD